VSAGTIEEIGLVTMESYSIDSISMCVPFYFVLLVSLSSMLGSLSTVRLMVASAGDTHMRRPQVQGCLRSRHSTVIILSPLVFMVSINPNTEKTHCSFWFVIEVFSTPSISRRRKCLLRMYRHAKSRRQ
jgi:hypothetical protein